MIWITNYTCRNYCRCKCLVGFNWFTKCNEIYPVSWQSQIWHRTDGAGPHIIQEHTAPSDHLTARRLWCCTKFFISLPFPLSERSHRAAAKTQAKTQSNDNTHFLHFQEEVGGRKRQRTSCETLFEDSWIWSTKLQQKDTSSVFLLYLVGKITNWVSSGHDLNKQQSRLSSLIDSVTASGWASAMSGTSRQEAFRLFLFHLSAAI